MAHDCKVIAVQCLHTMSVLQAQDPTTFSCDHDYQQVQFRLIVRDVTQNWLAQLQQCSSNSQSQLPASVDPLKSQHAAEAQPSSLSSQPSNYRLTTAPSTPPPLPQNTAYLHVDSECDSHTNHQALAYNSTSSHVGQTGVTPASTRTRRTPAYLSTCGKEGLGLRGGKMRLNSNGNWNYVRPSNRTSTRSGSTGTPTYVHASGATGRGSRGAAMYKTRNGTWHYESQR